MHGKILLSAGLLIAAAWPPSAGRPSKSVPCLALGIGAWTPMPPGAIWEGSRRLRLTNTPDPWLATLAGRRGWRSVQFVPDQSRPTVRSRVVEYDSAWVWLAPTPDSLLLLRPAILSEGMEVRGTWSGDTLRGRANTFSDAIVFSNGIAHLPRANVYGVRFICKDRAMALNATAAVERLRVVDRPDPALAAREDSLWSAEALRQLQHK